MTIMQFNRILSITRSLFSSSSTSSLLTRVTNNNNIAAPLLQKRSFFFSAKQQQLQPTNNVVFFKPTTQSSTSSMIVRSFSTTRRSCSLPPLRAEEKYNKPMQFFHWAMAIGMVANIGLVLAAQQLPGRDKDDGTPETKAKIKKRNEIMDLHESIGVLMLAFVLPRVIVRLASKKPAKMSGPTWEHMAGSLSHFLLYGALIFLPVSGLAFGYFSCWGVPFFSYHIPGAKKEDENKALTDFFYEWHHIVGQALEYLLVLHVSAVGYHHLLRNHNLFARMNPFSATAPPLATNTIPKQK